MGEGLGQVDVEDLETRELFELEEVAGDRGDEVGKRRSQILERPGELDQGTAVDRAGLRPGQAGFGHLLDHVQALDPSPEALLELGRLTGQRDERAGRLLAGHDLDRNARVVGGLDQVAGVDAVAHASGTTGWPLAAEA